MKAGFILEGQDLCWERDPKFCFDGGIYTVRAVFILEGRSYTVRAKVILERAKIILGSYTVKTLVITFGRELY